MQGYDKQFVVQGVHMIFDGYLGVDWPDAAREDKKLSESENSNNSSFSTDRGINRKSKLVFIGENFPARPELMDGFEACCVKHKLD